MKTLIYLFCLLCLPVGLSAQHAILAGEFANVSVGTTFTNPSLVNDYLKRHDVLGKDVHMSGQGLMLGCDLGINISHFFLSGSMYGSVAPQCNAGTSHASYTSYAAMLHTGYVIPYRSYTLGCIYTGLGPAGQSLGTRKDNDDALAQVHTLNGLAIGMGINVRHLISRHDTTVNDVRYVDGLALGLDAGVQHILTSGQWDEPANGLRANNPTIFYLRITLGVGGVIF